MGFGTAVSGFEHLLLLIDGVVEGAAAGDGLSEAAGEAGRFEVLAGSAENRGGRAELRDELPGFARAEAGDQAQGEPVQFIFFGQGGGDHPGDWWQEGGEVLGGRCPTLS